ncbi:MAG: 4'-phosphopantetheinyl transferase family protein [Eubacteriales bacterium]
MRFYYSLNFTGEKTVSEDLLCKALIMEGIAVKKEDIFRKKSGKPCLRCSDLEFSISHSRNVWICVFSDVKIGMDFQFFQEMKINDVAKRFFSDEEKSFLLFADEKEKNKIFFEIWSKKEAIGKFMETGIFKNGIGNINTVKAEDEKIGFIYEFESESKGILVKPDELSSIIKLLANKILQDDFALNVCIAKKRKVEGIFEIGIG